MCPLWRTPLWRISLWRISLWRTPLWRTPLCLLLGLLLWSSGCRATTPTPLPSPSPTATLSATATAAVRTLRAPTVVTPTPAAGELAERTAATLPVWQQYQARVTDAMQQAIPVLRLEEGMSDEQSLAQAIALRDPRVQRDLWGAETGVPLRNEIFGVYPVRPTDLTPATASCASSSCYRVELFNFAYNLTILAFVDLQQQQVLEVLRSTESQPDIPPALTQLAVEIAINAPAVIDALGGQPEAAAALMASTKTALSQTRCERSRHLCVAPTFVSGERALWAIVDLTDGVLVGIRWTEVGNVAAPVISEKQLQDEVVTRQFCDTVNTLTRDGWSFDYLITTSDGLRLDRVHFNNKPRFDSVSVVDWHVSYSTREGFGYSDAIGCPTFSQAAVVAFNGPMVEEITQADEVVGFALVQDFRSDLWPLPCNYHYQNRYEFYKDGRFRPVMINLGRGCGNDGWYRPVLRIAFSGDLTFSGWTGDSWQAWTTEHWQGPSNLVDPNGHDFRVTDAAGTGFYIAAGRGQFDDGGRGDNPYSYVTRRHVDRNEGDVDLITIGSCCEIHHEQGPEKFIDSPPEAIAATEIVFWYVAQMKNDDQAGQQYCWAESIIQDGVYVPEVYPCAAGPLFTPVTE
ncbi:MAG: hypothetical protein KF832_05370 [Caldilineaceae bacterium]|nr:hypothetical protein [Caldilineaceae bacterium]